MSRRSGIFLAIIGILLLLVGGVFISSFFRRGMAPAATPTPVPPQMETVVVLTHDVPLGTLLQTADLRETEIPLGIAPAGVVRTVGEAVGRMTKTGIVAGEMLMSHNLADPTNVQHDIPFIIKEDQVLMAFPANDLMSDINMLQRGDLVDILVSIDIEIEPQEAGIILGVETPEPETVLFTFDAIQRIEISAVVVEIVQQGEQGGGGTGISLGQGEATPTPAPTAAPAPSDVNTIAILLALNPQDALLLKNLNDAGGTFDIVLRNPTSTQLFELESVSEQYLIDKYGLTIEK